MVSIQSDDNQQRLLILPILLLTFAHMPQAIIAGIDYTGYLWLTIFQGLQQAAPLLLAMALAISRSRYQYDMQPLNACLSYVLLAKLLHSLGPANIPTDIIAALLSGYAVVWATPHTQKNPLTFLVTGFPGGCRCPAVQWFLLYAAGAAGSRTAASVQSVLTAESYRRAITLAGTVIAVIWRYSTAVAGNTGGMAFVSGITLCMAGSTLYLLDFSACTD